MGTTSISGGHDTFVTVFGKGSVNLGAGSHDTISIGSLTDTVSVQGLATVSGAWGAFGSATISGGELDVNAAGAAAGAFAVSGHATLQGGILPGEFAAGSGSTSIIGGAANDTFIGGSGNATMTGGSGGALFEFTATQGGSNLITNFVSGTDSLYLDGKSLNFLQSKGDITTHGGNTFISLGQTTIELQGVTKLNPSDILHK